MIGSGILILCFGWCLLFMYLNVCGARRIAYEISKTVYQNDVSTQCDFPPPEYSKATYLEQESKKALHDSQKERYSALGASREEELTATVQFPKKR